MGATITAPQAAFEQAAFGAENTLDPVLTVAHDAWMAEAHHFLLPVTFPEATFWERWGAVRYMADQFPERFQTQRALLEELRPYLTDDAVERLGTQAGRVARLSRDFDELTPVEGTAREVARTTRDLLEALRLWCAEIEFACAGIRQDSVSEQGMRLLGRIRPTCGPMLVL